MHAEGACKEIRLKKPLILGGTLVSWDKIQGRVATAFLLTLSTKRGKRPFVDLD